MSDERSFDALFAEHYPDLLRFAIRRVGADAAPDIVGDVFLVAWRRRTEVPADAARLWLFGVASRVIANHVRSDRRQARLRRRLAAEPVLTTRSDESERVLAALAQLRPKEQEVLRLTEWEQLTADEAAEVLGCSAGAFRVRLHRARKNFTAALAAQDAEED